MESQDSEANFSEKFKGLRMKAEKPDPPEPPPRNPLRVMASLSSEVNLHFIKILFSANCRHDR